MNRINKTEPTVLKFCRSPLFLNDPITRFAQQSNYGDCNVPIMCLSKLFDSSNYIILLQIFRAYCVMNVDFV